MIIYLVRHGQTKSNKQKGFFFNGRIDNNLNPLGIIQAKKLGKFFADKKIDLIFSSPSKRTKSTAEIICSAFKKKPDIILNSDIKEADFGIFDGKHIDLIKMKYTKMYLAREENKFQYRIPEGESYKDVYNRVYEFLKKLYLNFRDKKAVLVVTHATTIKLILYALTNYSLEKIEQIKYPNACIFQFNYKVEGNKIFSKTVLFNKHL